MSTNDDVHVVSSHQQDDASCQHQVIANNDYALDKAHEHHHVHLHHNANAEKGREDEVIYSKETTDERSNIPHQDHQDHDLARRKHAEISRGAAGATDFEKADSGSEEADPQSHSLATFYKRYRFFFHLFVWLIFTGSVFSTLSTHLDKCSADFLQAGGLQAWSSMEYTNPAAQEQDG